VLCDDTLNDATFRDLYVVSCVLCAKNVSWRDRFRNECYSGAITDKTEQLGEDNR
jgi:hypothetical protein